MKSWKIERHGGVDALALKNEPDPRPGPMQARVRVEAVGLNHLDLWVRKGVSGHKFPLPLTPGCDIAGTLDEFGAGAEEALRAQGFKKGSPILINPGVSCGRCKACLGGFDPLCPEYGILGETCNGGCSEFVVVPIANLILRPESVSAITAAALPIPFLTAWTMLVRKADLKAGETILIHAGGSGVSVAAIQIAKLLGAHVITTVGSDEKIEKAEELGADHVINYKKAPFREELKKILADHGTRGVEVALDHIGADTFNDSIKSLVWGGRLVTCGATSGHEVKIDLRQVFFKNISILGTTMGSKADLLKIVELVDQGRLKPIFDRVFPMAELREAHEKLESRNVFGKILVTAP